MKLYQAIANALDAFQRCRATGNDEWANRHEATLTDIAENNLPHGSGFDNGCSIAATGKPDRITIYAPFHPISENGFYEDWEDYTITVKPSLMRGFTLRITGPKRNRDYVAETIAECLNEEYQYPQVTP